jgi:hypothetical protein
LLFAFGSCLLGLYFDFLVWEAFGREKNYWRKNVKGKMLKRGWQKVCIENFNIGFRKQSWERTSYIGLKKGKAKEKPKRTCDSVQCKSKDWDLKSYVYAVFRHGCWFASLSTEALRELKRDETVQAWGKRL